MKLCFAKIKTSEGMFEKPVAVKNRDVKVIENFLNDLYDTDHEIISIQGFRIEDWSGDDEYRPDPPDDSEGIDCFP